jgi:hypothetical protein
VIAVAATPAQAQPQEPEIDIKTEEFKLKCKNGKLKGEGDLKIAILSTCGFDACEAVCEALKEGVEFYAYNETTGNFGAPVDSKCKDVNGDGLEDYQFKFLVKDLVCDGVLDKDTTELFLAVYPVLALGPATSDDCYTQAEQKADCDEECEKDDDDSDDSDDCEESKDDDDCDTGDADDSDDCEQSDDDDDCDTGDADDSDDCDTGDADDSDDCEKSDDDDDCEQTDVDDSDECDKSDDDDCEKACDECVPNVDGLEERVEVTVDIKTEEFDLDCENGKLEGEGDLKVAFISTCEWDACKAIDEDQIFVGIDEDHFACPVKVKCKDVNCDGVDDLQAKFLVEDLVCAGVLTKDTQYLHAAGISCDGTIAYIALDVPIDDYYEQAEEKLDCEDDCDKGDDVDDDDCDKDDDDDCEPSDADDSDDDCDIPDDDDDCDKGEDDDDCEPSSNPDDDDDCETGDDVDDDDCDDDDDDCDDDDDDDCDDDDDDDDCVIVVPV